MIDICHIKHWQLPRGGRKAEGVNEWYTEKAAQGLLLAYGWPKISESAHGPMVWTNDNIDYNILLQPFYIPLPSGTINVQNDTPFSAQTMGLWGARTSADHGQATVDFYIIPAYEQAFVPSSGWRRDAYSLRCLTQ